MLNYILALVIGTKSMEDFSGALIMNILNDTESGKDAEYVYRRRKGNG